MTTAHTRTWVKYYWMVSIIFIMVISENSIGQILPEWEDTIGGNNPNYYFGSDEMRVDDLGNTYTAGSKCQGTNCSLIFAKYNTSGVRLFVIDTLPNYGMRAMSIDDSSNIYIALSSYPTPSELLLLKYNSSGNLIWSSTDAITSGMRFLGVRKMINDAYGNVYIAGEGDTITNQPRYNIVTMKFDPNGSLLWSRKYYYGDGYVFLGLDSNQNVYVTGRGLDSTNSNWDILLVKYDANGNQQWNRNFSNLDDNENPVGMEVSPAGNCYIFGENRPLNASTWADYLIIRYDSNGNLVWHSIPNTGVGWDRARDIKIDADENVYVTGTQNANSSYWYNYLTMKYDSSGNSMWIKVYDNLDYVVDESAQSLCVDDNNNVYVVGSSNSQAPGLSGLLIIKYDANGDSLWSSIYNYVPLVNYSGFHCSCDAANNLYLSGNILPHILTLKYGSTVGIPELELSSNSFSIYPNPANTTINIQMNEFSNIEIYNVLGEKIVGDFESYDPYEMATLDVSHFDAGIYFIKGGVNVKKFIKQ